MSKSEWYENYHNARCYGRASGKTLTMSQHVHELAKEKNLHIALIGENVRHAIETMVEGPNGLLSTADPENPVTYVKSQRRIIWEKTGTVATIFTLIRRTGQ